jgi:hypothetical protein
MGLLMTPRNPGPPRLEGQPAKLQTSPADQVPRAHPTVTVAVLAGTAWSGLEADLGILAASCAEMEVEVLVVVPDSMAAVAARWTRSSDPVVRVVTHAAGLTRAARCDLALRDARTDVVLLTDDDAVASTDWSGILPYRVGLVRGGPSPAGSGDLATVLELRRVARPG